MVRVFPFTQDTPQESWAVLQSTSASAKAHLLPLLILNAEESNRPISSLPTEQEGSQNTELQIQGGKE